VVRNPTIVSIPIEWRLGIVPVTVLLRDHTIAVVDGVLDVLPFGITQPGGNGLRFSAMAAQNSPAHLVDPTFALRDGVHSTSAGHMNGLIRSHVGLWLSVCVILRSEATKDLLLVRFAHQQQSRVR